MPACMAWPLGKEGAHDCRRRHCRLMACRAPARPNPQPLRSSLGINVPCKLRGQGLGLWGGRLWAAMGQRLLERRWAGARWEGVKTVLTCRRPHPSAPASAGEQAMWLGELGARIRAIALLSKAHHHATALAPGHLGSPCLSCTPRLNPCRPHSPLAQTTTPATLTSRQRSSTPSPSRSCECLGPGQPPLMGRGRPPVGLLAALRQRASVRRTRVPPCLPASHAPPRWPLACAAPLPTCSGT